MLKTGILNPDLLDGLARLGHTDTVVIADCGLPLPAGARVVDLTLVRGVPTFEQVLRAVGEAIVVESVTIADEARGTAPERLVAEALSDAPVQSVSHERLKQQLPHAKLIVRTGEATPYANAILRCGVDF
ncbi:D-ribose pyranase [Zhihengliuella halotolerans]|uniref:D-ribose pyranase n=1 Tax=Zhihengliuella halotolerans TaxID=370736 RepID=A0A4Q8AEQ6_9MICC|nr:D-ribose pyranase [Zhihengliuella halotolerans]RZU62718.1 D-ribose pyranase [Zhihengliuella halotolerans]